MRDSIVKIVIVIAAAISLAGCGGLDSYLYDDPPTTSASSAEGSGGASAAPANAHCEALARQRASDAEPNGDDEDTEEAIYRFTYDDCVAWDARHNQ